ncbi:MAG: hypothetical protein H3C31_02975 [Brumimicrobium sp.]|nr:hypothetical protein [Brumimicrobium sp.]
MKNLLSFIQNHRYAILMSAGILILLWPLTFFYNTPKWDNISGFLPYRYFISDAIWNGHFPYWNSFQHMGYPIYADPQSGMWNPITWLFILFGKYTITSLILEINLYFLLAGWGMYWFITHFIGDKRIAAIIGFSYALSGLMVSTAQIMVFIAGIAWLPWCLGAVYLFFQKFKYVYAILTGFFIALNTSSASPAYTIILIYIFLFVFIYYFWKYRKDVATLKRILLGGGSMLITAIVLLLPYLVSGFEFAPYFNRLERLPYSDYLLANPFVPIDYISFIFPYSVLSKTESFTITDITLRSGYFGLVAFIFVLFAFTRNRMNKKVIILCFIAFIGLIAALGSYTPIYKILYHLPGFGVFRHPSFFKTYSVFALLIVASIGLQNFLEKPILTKREKTILYSFFSIIILVGILFYFRTSPTEIKNNLIDFLQRSESSDQYMATHLVINCIIIIFIVGVCYIAKKLFQFSWFSTLFLFAFLDIGIQTQLSIPYTVTYSFKYADYKQFFRTLPSDISQENLDYPMSYFNESQGLKKIDGIWLNVSTFNKTISFEGYNPCQIKYFEQAKIDSSLEFNLENPLFYFANKEKKPNSPLEPGLIWGINNEGNITSQNTTIHKPHVGYNSFSVEVQNQNPIPQWLILNQNYYPQWKAYYNGKELPISRINTHIMGIMIPGNSNGKVVYHISSPVSYLGGISIIAYLLVGSYLLIVLFPHLSRFRLCQKQQS